MTTELLDRPTLEDSGTDDPVEHFFVSNINDPDPPVGTRVRGLCGAWFTFKGHVELLADAQPKATECSMCWEVFNMEYGGL